jgi:hypothetical protein
MLQFSALAARRRQVGGGQRIGPLGLLRVARRARRFMDA